MNLPGALVATSAMALLTYALSVGEYTELWSARTFMLLAVCVALFYVLVQMERRAANPLIPKGLFRHMPLVRALLGSSIFGAIIGPSALFLTLYLQNINQLDPLRTGFAYLPQEVTVFLSANLAGRYVSRFGTRNVLAMGLLSFAIGAAWLMQLAASGGYADTVLPALLFLGFGIGSVNVAGTIAATEGVPQLMHGASTGIWKPEPR